MKCANCGIEVSKDFKAAISANRCPACNKKIIESNNTSSLAPLCELIEGQIGKETGINIEELAIKIISTFDVCAKNERANKVINKSLERSTEIKPEDLEYQQKISAKPTLEKIREEAYNEALLSTWGMGSESAATLGEMMVNQKKEESRNNILTGTKGVIRRRE